MSKTKRSFRAAALAAIVVIAFVQGVGLAASAAPVHVGEPPANEATIVRLPDDSLRIYHILRPAGTELRSVGSTDNGKTWGDDRLEFKLPGVAYYGNQVLVDSDGELHAAFHIQGKGDKGYNGRHYDLWHAKTTDGRKKWGEPKRFFEGYVGSMRGFVQLKSGRLLLPVAIAIPQRQKKVEEGKPDYGWNDAVVFYSDDKGATWSQTSKPLSVLQDNTRGRTRYGAVEPHVVQMNDGRAWMLVRTKNGFLYESLSQDGAEWSQLKPSPFISSDSPATSVRLKDGRLALFVNVCQRWDDPMSYAIGGREVLHGAISSDDGKTWQGFRDVLYDFKGAGKGDRGTAYPSAAQAADGMIVLVSGQGEERKSILRIDPNWLAETSASSSFAKDEWPHWTTHEGKGAEIIAHPDNPSARCLSVARTDAKAIAGASWNFPATPSGTLTLRVKPREGFAGAVISLADHYAVTGDTKADENAIYSITLDAKALPAGQSHDVAFSWTAGGDAVVNVDGKPAGKIKAKRTPAFGINYVRLSAGDAAGFLVESATAGGASRAATAAAANREITIVALGDSITRGARPARGGAPAVAVADTFGSLLEAGLKQASVNAQVINAGIGGNRTDQGVARLAADVLSLKPDVVTIMYGTNDSCYDDGKTVPRLTVEQYESNLCLLVEQSHAAGAKVILMTPPPLTTKWPLGMKHPVYIEKGVNGPLGTYVEAIKRVGTSMNVPVIDHFAAWSALPAAEMNGLLPDGCHPNAAGHKLLAAAILPVLLQQVKADAQQADATFDFTKRRGCLTGGSVIDIGRAGSFNGKWSTCPSVLRAADGYRMYYSSFFNEQDGLGGIGLAVSADGVDWICQNDGKPVLPLGADGAFDDAQVFGPDVLYDGKQYLMWYTGDAGIKHPAGFFTYQIGLATSRDGVTWTRANNGQPVLGNGPKGSPDEVQAATPSVLREGDGYRMWYAAWAKAHNHTICVARSVDGITWERENGGQPVQGLNPSIAYGHAVTRIGDRYIMLYMALSAARSLYAAASTDGTHWTMLNDGKPVILTGSAGGFDENIVGHPGLLVENDTLRAWYTGYQTRPGGLCNWELRIGLAEARIPAGWAR
jgi:lysophospholipase L1-like esterase